MSEQRPDDTADQHRSQADGTPPQTFDAETDPKVDTSRLDDPNAMPAQPRNVGDTGSE